MKQLEPISIVSPGFFGLNTQESGATLSPNFAQQADNVVIDQYGRLGARKGWTMQTTNGDVSIPSGYVRFLHEHINADGDIEVISGAQNKLFKGGIDSTDLTEITPDYYTITKNQWSGACLNDRSVIVQKNHEPLVYDELRTPALQTMSGYGRTVDGTVSTYANLPGSPSTGDKYLVADAKEVYKWDGSAWVDITLQPMYGTSYPKQVIAAYGRFWAHNGKVVTWSTDVADPNFPRFSGGTSGYLNINSVLPHNVDEITAIAVHNDLLIVMCRHNIVVYQNASNPVSLEFRLADVIRGVGCVAQNSVQVTGSDLVFLSDTGVRSFGRLVQEKSLPLRDLTKNIRNELVETMTDEILKYQVANGADTQPLTEVSSVYSEIEGFYLITFPRTRTTYVLNMQSFLEDGSARCTVWSTFRAWAWLRTSDRRIFMGQTEGIGRYMDYSDNGNKYRLRFMSHHLDLGDSGQIKLLKQIKTVVFGGNGQDFSINIGTDYESGFTKFPFTLPVSNNAYFGEDEFNTSAEFTAGILTDKLSSHVIGSGNVFQIGCEAVINGAPFSVQSLTCLLKRGRIN